MTYMSTNPATGEAGKTFPFIDDAALEQVVATAQACFERDWSRRTPADRAKVLARVAALMRERADTLARLVTTEMGKLLVEAKGEVQLSAAILDYYADHVDDYMRTRELEEAPGSFVEIRPLGILLAIEPWNFPYYQLARVAGPQLAVGNVLIVKHAANVPQCAGAFAQLFVDAGAPEGVYSNVFARHEQSDVLIDDARIRGVTLTGSERAGAHVAERAGRNLKKSVMELGGSDPMIVLDDAPMEVTLDNAVWGRMFVTGQGCADTKRVIVVGRERGAQFLEGLKARMAALEPGDPMDETTRLGPLSSEGAIETLLGQIDAATAAGAEVASGGHRIDRPGAYLEPTILTGIAADNPAHDTEFFGPVLSFYVVETEAEAVALANATPFGLGATVFSGDVARARKVAEGLEAGMVTINNPTSTAPELPFGGVKNSGYGRELSQLGFGEFVNQRLVSVHEAGSPPPG